MLRLVLAVLLVQGALAAPPRAKREPKNSQSFAALRRRLSEDKDKKEEALDGAGRQMNFTRVPPHPQEDQYGDVNTEQVYNKENNKMRLLYSYKSAEPEISYAFPGTECDFERECRWKWKTDSGGGFFVANPSRFEAGDSGPPVDADNKSSGNYLLLRLKPSTKDLHVTSPLFSPSPDTCRIQVWIYQAAMSNASIRIVAETVNHTQWVVSEIHGQDSQKWKKYDISVGKISQDFNIILEVVPAPKPAKDAVVAFDNIALLECFPESDRVNACTPFQYKCSQTNLCINNTKICDINLDCDYGDDEALNCDKIPYGARCNFEQDWCGWHNVEGKVLQWARHNGSTPTNRTGPSFDHTYQNTTGKYMYVNMHMGKEVRFASTATLQSILFNPPPRVHGNSSSRYYNSCTIRFYLHQYGTHKSGLMLQVTELRPKENVTTELYWSYNDYGDNWVPKIVILPNITHRYYLHFDARRGIRYRGDVAIDDFSMSPECFGLNIPAGDLNMYNYWNPDVERPTNTPHKDFVNETYYDFTTCGTRGRYGPAQEDCMQAYNNTPVRVQVMHVPGMNGIQKWTAPAEGHYTFILLGASGGKGSGGMGSSRGAMVRTVVDLRKGQEVFILVGQEGNNACLKSLAHQSNSSCKSLRNDNSSNLTGVRGVLKMEVADGGGGGGGATFVFMHNRTKQPVPLAIAAGGGGLGLGRFIDTGSQHGQAINMSRPPVTGQMYGPKSAGAGGGWEMFQGQVAFGHERLMGMPLTQGAIGGQACYDSIDGRGDGGFGGGGGGCTAGGGGGGYAGGNAWSTNTTNGEGGYSFLDPSRSIPNLSEARSGYHAGPGSVLIIPAVPGCGCNYRCLALDARRSEVVCICPKDWNLDSDGKSCIPLESPDTYPDWLVVIMFFITISLVIAFGVMCFMLYNRYQHRTIGMLGRKVMLGQDLVQLNRLRGQNDSMHTEYNPNYEFGGTTYTLKDLKDIPRSQLQLQKALGQGAFGEVYQGFYRQRSGDAVEMPVAVKTLPALSTHEAEMDFLMEALIMSKFDHPNIVHFIGVCFDKHPRFIVLELLAGGDLKNFLRESRPKPDKSSALTMRDLVMISMDVAKGCKYLESHRFIHRDIAARNCLLTTKGPGRVVKIADFGMSRDIYRSDYYRKGGRAMLPIKWMPPEAFLDGIFTTKTDVWSFGVLLWEIMSMGYMPYTGCANRQVMQLVTSGGRLEPPTNSPAPIYGIMTQCWHPEPEQRPDFGLILERLGYCAQDPEVLSTPLPLFNRPPSQERDTTIMRPRNDDHCLEVPKVADYLIPNNTTIPTIQNPIGSTSSVDKLIPENSDSWETSFVLPHSKSTQPLLPDVADTAEVDEGFDSGDNKLLTPDVALTERVSPISLPANIMAKPKESSLRAGVSLDAGALAKQSMSPVHNNSYANITTEEKITSNGVLPNNPASLGKESGYLSSLYEANNGIIC